MIEGHEGSVYLQSVVIDCANRGLCVVRLDSNDLRVEGIRAFESAMPFVLSRLSILRCGDFRLEDGKGGGGTESSLLRCSVLCSCALQAGQKFTRRCWSRGCLSPSCPNAAPISVEVSTIMNRFFGRRDKHTRCRCFHCHHPYLFSVTVPAWQVTVSARRA
jgi:hypothetical protein